MISLFAQLALSSTLIVVIFPTFPMVTFVRITLCYNTECKDDLMSSVCSHTNKIKTKTPQKDETLQEIKCRSTVVFVKPPQHFFSFVLWLKSRSITVASRDESLLH